MKLNAIKVAKEKQPGRYADGKGLYLLVRPTGAKSWVLRVVVNGRRRDFGLGAVDLVSLAEAREKAIEGRRLAKQGIVPSAVWRRVDDETSTFEQAARKYHEAIRAGWKEGKHADQWINTLEQHAFPAIGKRLVSEIDAPAIQSVLMPLWLVIPETARRVRQRIFATLDYAKGQGWREHEAPVRAVNQLMSAIKQPRKSNFPAVPWQDVPALVANLRKASPTVARLVALFTILTTARPGMVRNMPWREVDLEAAEWRIPPERMKAGKLHIVPLVPAAVAILQEMRGLFGHKPDDLVFPGGKKGKPLSDVAVSKAFKLAGGEGFTLHGTARSSFRDWAAETGFADAWAEAQLAHGNPDKTEAAYKRTTFFTQRRDKLLPAWERFLLQDGANVIALVERRA